MILVPGHAIPAPIRLRMPGRMLGGPGLAVRRKPHHLRGEGPGGRAFPSRQCPPLGSVPATGPRKMSECLHHDSQPSARHNPARRLDERYVSPVLTGFQSPRSGTPRHAAASICSEIDIGNPAAPRSSMRRSSTAINAITPPPVFGNQHHELRRVRLAEFDHRAGGEHLDATAEQRWRAVAGRERPSPAMQ